MHIPSRRTRANLDACATDQGIIAAAAMDQRGSLKRALDKAGAPRTDAGVLGEFKTALAEALSPHASAILIDPMYGLDASKRRADGCGLLLSYEKSGYDTTEPGRQPDLMEHWSVKRIGEADGSGVKLLVYYNPTEPSEINDRKHAFVERVGAECEAEGIPLFLEPVTYDDDVSDPLEYAKRKPKYVRDTIAEFSKDRYRVSVLKVEYPIEAKYTAGLEREPEATAYELDEARDLIADAAAAAQRPFIYLSAGVDMDVFIELLELAADVGTNYHGVLCGRATWKGGIQAYAQDGDSGLRRWLEEHGVPNIERLNRTVSAGAKPWWDAFGGRQRLDAEA
jgi:tagatose 1,6-diphosphate aldolase